MTPTRSSTGAVPAAIEWLRPRPSSAIYCRASTVLGCASSSLLPEFDSLLRSAFAFLPNTTHAHAFVPSLVRGFTGRRRQLRPAVPFRSLPQDRRRSALIDGPEPAVHAAIDPAAASKGHCLAAAPHPVAVARSRRLGGAVVDPHSVCTLERPPVRATKSALARRERLWCSPARLDCCCHTRTNGWFACPCHIELEKGGGLDPTPCVNQRPASFLLLSMLRCCRDKC